ERGEAAGAGLAGAGRAPAGVRVAAVDLGAAGGELAEGQGGGGAPAADEFGRGPGPARPGAAVAPDGAVSDGRASRERERPEGSRKRFPPVAHAPGSPRPEAYFLPSALRLSAISASRAFCGSANFARPSSISTFSRWPISTFCSISSSTPCGGSL